MISCGAKNTVHTVKSTGGYQSLFPCLGEGTHVITLRLVLRYRMSKCREQKRQARLNLRAPKRKVAWGWKNKIKNKYKNQEIFSLPPRLSQFYRVEILARTGVFHIPLLIPEEKEGLLSSGISYFIPSPCWFYRGEQLKFGQQAIQNDDKSMKIKVSSDTALQGNEQTYWNLLSGKLLTPEIYRMLQYTTFCLLFCGRPKESAI